MNGELDMQADAHGQGGQYDGRDHGAAVAEKTETDPVCGMKVDAAVSKHRFKDAGRMFHFCSARCREKFVAAPANYLTNSARAALPAAKGTIYTCPMHPKIRQVGPGVSSSLILS